MQPKTKSLGKNCAFSTHKRGILSIIVMTEATLLFHRGITLCHSIYYPKRPGLQMQVGGFDNLKSFTAIIYVTVSND